MTDPPATLIHGVALTHCDVVTNGVRLHVVQAGTPQAPPVERAAITGYGNEALQGRLPTTRSAGPGSGTCRASTKPDLASQPRYSSPV